MTLKNSVAIALIAAVGFITARSIVSTSQAETGNEKVVVSPILETTAAVTNVKVGKKKIGQLNIDSSRAVFVFGPIGSTEEQVSRIYKLDKENNKAPIYLIIDSPGGSVFGGAVLLSAIEGVNAPVKTVCVGLCASMAAIIHSYGTERLMTDRAVVMYHDYAGGFNGYGSHMKSRLGLVDRYTGKMDAYIAQRAGMPLDEFLVNTYKELWLDSEDATARHFNDRIVSFDVAKLLPSNAEERKSLEAARNITKTILDGTAEGRTWAQ